MIPQRTASGTSRRRTYLSDWVSTELRWELTADRSEQDTLRQYAHGCGNTTVEYTLA
ncbi:hypothetical protein [Streptomyces purpurogeneiscleroticus]|uniref:hypothetical protein n=1 Tax=Streptomyces purpurogeneiscleroticus TaxID=68259 RepID=UPI001CC1850E|nr:hypothetical protein [Streptomyces purpurogeneiscleroticus]